MERHPSAACSRSTENKTAIPKSNLCTAAIGLCELTALGPYRQTEVRQKHCAWCVNDRRDSEGGEGREDFVKKK